MSGTPLIWDACGLLNLMATARSGEILAALTTPCVVVREVRTGETLYLRPLPEEDPRGALVLVDPTPLLASGLLQEITLTPEEQELYVEYAAEVDDGEARTAAAAITRGLRIATDDRAAIRFVSALSPAPGVLTTPDWLKQWADTAQPDPVVLGAVLRRVEVCARYRPRKLHPLYDWWNDRVVHP